MTWLFYKFSFGMKLSFNEFIHTLRKQFAPKMIIIVNLFGQHLQLSAPMNKPTIKEQDRVMSTHLKLG